LFIKDHLYSLSDNLIRINNLSDLKEVLSIKID